MLGVQKKKKSLRTKVIVISEDEEEIKTNIQPINYASKTIKTTSLLSFEDEGDGEEIFQLKKSYKTKSAGYVFDETQTITDYKYEKPDNTIPVKSKNNVKLKKKKKKVLESVDEINNSEPENKEEELKYVLDAGDIPTPAQIHAARKQRQYVRENYGEDQDVPTSESGETNDPHQNVRHLMNPEASTINDNKSRLIREDENDLSETELDTYEGKTESSYLSMSTIMERESNSKYQSKRDMFSYLQQKWGDKTRNLDDSAVQYSSDEFQKDTDDEEFDKWEREQIMKGTNIPQSQRGVSHVANLLSLDPETRKRATKGPAFVQDGAKPEMEPFGEEDFTGSNYEMVKKEIFTRIETLRSNLSVHRMDLNATRENQAGNGAFLQLLDEETESIGRDFKFYQNFKTYVEDLVECHNEKVALINSLEARLYNLLKQRASRLANRRLQDLRDESEEYSLIQMMGAGKNKAYDPDESAKRRIAEREARRGRRRRARENLPLKDTTTTPHYEGMSSDDEEIRAESTAFATQKKSLLDECEKVFEDTLEEYCTLDKILDKFSAWKSSYPDTYQGAYVNLCLVKICENLLRHSLLSHDFCEEKYVVQETPWLIPLLRYCGPGDGSIMNLKVEEDDRIVIVPNLIADVFIPKLTFFIQNVYDPLSTRQTENLVSLIGEIANYCPSFNADDRQTRDFYKIIQDKFIKSLENDIYLPVYPPNVMESKNSAVINYHNRQFWTCIKLMENVLTWKDLMSEELIKELAFDGILNRYLILAFQNSPINKGVYEKCLRIGRNLKSLNTINDKGEIMSEFQPFWRYLNYLVEKIREFSSSSLHTEFYPYDKEEILETLGQLINNIAKKRKKK